jgi:hypothetical protein
MKFADWEFFRRAVWFSVVVGCASVIAGYFWGLQ